MAKGSSAPVTTTNVTKNGSVAAADRAARSCDAEPSAVCGKPAADA